MFGLTGAPHLPDSVAALKFTGMKPGVLNCFCFQNALKLIYEHLQSLKFFRGYNPQTPLKGQGKGFGRRGQRDRWEVNGDTGGITGGKGKDK
jgi:hypothetical protein